MGILFESADVISYRQEHLVGAMSSPIDMYETVHTIAINTRETEFGSIVQPIPITLKTYKQFPVQTGVVQHLNHPINGYGYSQAMTPIAPPPVPVTEEISSSSFKTVKECDEKPNERYSNTVSNVRPPPKKKWIKEYLEEEPQQQGLAVRLVSVRPPSPPSAAPPALIDYVEHSRARTASISHSAQQVPSPPSVGSNGSNSSGSGSAPRAGTREVHNKLEKNRRAHLKECFEMLKRQLPATSDDKKTSNLSILGSAIRYIQVLRRKERECEHEMERLAREKIAAQQRLAALKREVSVRAAALTTRAASTDPDDKDRDERINGQVLGIPISISPSPPHVARMEASPPRTLNLSTKLRTVPIQIAPTTAQVVRTCYGARHNTLTLTTLAPADPSTQNGHGQSSGENGVTNAIGTLVHPAQIHLPLSQVVSSGGLVVGGALQLVSTSQGLRVLQAPLHTNGVSTGENNRIPKENGLVSHLQTSTGDHNGVVVNGLPLIVSQPGTHLLHAHKMVETQVVKASTPLTMSAQYLSTTIVKPVVVVSSAPPT